MTNDIAHKFSVAPMMDWTDRHCRAFHRALSARALLYSEMVTADAVLHGDRDRLLGYSACEHPVALQLGGSDPDKLAEAARIGAEFGYDEINLNVGCPSDRVQSGRFGACLMLEPDLVARCLVAMRRASPVPVTVKCRIGVDDQQPDSVLPDFLRRAADAGIATVIIHARKAWLKGLSPKQNRDVPPLDYALVYRMKADFPQLRVILNGGVDSLDEVKAHLAHVDGVMMGRAAYHTPALLLRADRDIFGTAAPVRGEVEAVRGFLGYIREQTGRGVPLAAITRHMLGLFGGQPGARKWRRLLSVDARGPGAGADLVEAALDKLFAGAPSEMAD